MLASLRFMALATMLNAIRPRAIRLLISGRISLSHVAVMPRYTYVSSFSVIFPSTSTVDVMAIIVVTQAHVADYRMVAGVAYVSEHAPRFLRRLSYQDYDGKTSS